MASPAVRADEGVLADFLGVSSIVPERDGAAEDFFALVGPDFPEGEFIAAWKRRTRSASRTAAARQALARSVRGRAAVTRGAETGASGKWGDMG